MNLNLPDNDLVLRYQGFVRSVALTAWKSTLGNVELDDLISYGQVGLIQAVRSYDPTSGVEFATYAFYRVRGAIFDGYTSMQWLSRAQYKRIRMQHLSDDVIECQEQNLQSAQVDDRPDDATWSAETIGKLFFVQMAFELSGDDRQASQFADSSSSAPGQAIEQAEVHATVRQAISELPEAERDLIQTVYYDGKSLTGAAQAAGKSKSWASRLHDRALDRLMRKLQSFEPTDISP